MVLTTLFSDVIFGPSSRYHWATSGLPRRPVRVHTAPKVARPTPTPTTAATMRRLRPVPEKARGWWRSTSIISTTVRISTRNCVMATSGAPSSSTCRVTPVPVTPNSTAACRRLRARSVAATPMTTMVSGIRSIQESMPSILSGISMPPMPGTKNMTPA